MKRIVWLVSLLLLVATAPASALPWQQIAAEARKSIIFLTVEFVDPNSRDLPYERQNICASSNQGTAFVVSKNGFALTALHLLDHPMKTMPDGSKIDTCSGYTDVRIRGRIGYSRTGVELFADRDFRRPDPVADALLLHFPEKTPAYDAASICSLVNPQTSSEYRAYGFPYGEDFTPTRVEFSNADGPSGRWVGSSDFTHGMSGGPIYNDNGFAIAFVQGGRENTPAVRYMVPLFAAKAIIESTGAHLNDCAPDPNIAERDGRLYWGGVYDEFGDNGHNEANCIVPNEMTGHCRCPTHYESFDLSNAGFVVCYSRTAIPTTDLSWGGAYNIKNSACVNNPLTGGCSCPTGFRDVGLSDAWGHRNAGVHLCFSEVARPNALVWGGAFEVGGPTTVQSHQNPATNAPSCPTGFSALGLLDGALQFCYRAK